MYAMAGVLALALLWGCNQSAEKRSAKQEGVDVAEAQAFIEEYTAEWLKLYKAEGEAQWAANTRIVEGDDTIEEEANRASEAMAAFSGSVETIEKTRAFLERKDRLDPLQVKQLEAILYQAANSPQTAPDLVKRRIAAETEQNSKLFGFDFTIDGKSVSTNEIDDLLEDSNDLDARLNAWRASKEVGKVLKGGLAELVSLRNQTVQALGYDNYFHYQVSDYGMTVDEMMALNRQLVEDLRPLYRELHTWARYEFAKRYGVDEVPDLLPAHWLPNRWAQDWSSMVTVEGLDIDGALADKEPEWLVKQAERFYRSLGFGELPASFWEKSSLYPLPPDANYKKNTHASAWHIDLQDDVRCLMSVVPSARWYETTHHELGHIYYYISYTNPDVPPLLREGANRAFHEGVGSLLGMASMQKPFMAGLGLVDPDAETDQIKALLKEALNTVVFIPFSAGTMTHFERDLYAGGLTKDEFNKRWWAHVRSFQGVAPPQPRGEDYCDAATKTHIINDAAQYYDYALSYVILHQLHDHIAKNILDQDPRQTNYYGSKDVGKFLYDILKLGGSEDWRKVMRDRLGQELSAKPMLDYFEPLLAWLQERNQGREHTLPSL